GGGGGARAGGAGLGGRGLGVVGPGPGGGRRGGAGRGGGGGRPGPPALPGPRRRLLNACRSAGVALEPGPSYRGDVSTRYIGARDRRRWLGRARVRDPRPPPAVPDARVRAAQAAQRATRHVPRVLLRLAVPHAAPDEDRRLDQ